MTPNRQSGDRRAETVAPGIVRRHQQICKGRARRACTCSPSYLARISYGPREERRRVSDTFPTLEAAVAWQSATRAILAGGGRGPVVKPSAPSLRDAAVSFLHRARAGTVLTRSRRPYSSATVDGYETALRRHVLPFTDPATGLILGDLPIDALEPRVAQSMVDGITTARSAETARLAAAALNSVLRFGYETLRVLDAPPVKPLLPPPHQRRDRHLDPLAADTIIAAGRIDDEQHGRSLMEPLVELLAGSGLRISEALGLVWGSNGLDLTAEPPTVRVSRATTKTDAGARTVPLDGETASALRRHFLATGRPADGTLVFARSDGTAYMRGGAPRTAFTRISKATGIEDVGAHLLRHSHATWLASAQLPDAALAARLGHTDASFTRRRYSHAMLADTNRAPQLLEALRRAHREGA